MNSLRRNECSFKNGKLVDGYINKDALRIDDLLSEA